MTRPRATRGTPDQLFLPADGYVAMFQDVPVHLEQETYRRMEPAKPARAAGAHDERGPAARLRVQLSA